MISKLILKNLYPYPFVFYMKITLNIFLIFLIPVINTIARSDSSTVFVMEIRAEIDPRMSRYVDLALSKAKDVKADFIVVDMNTFGGTVDDADKIRTALLNYPKPVLVFINKNAASAGALIAIACDSIYMQPGSNIGAATVVSGNDGMPVPEKYQSYMRSMMRSTAEVNKRDPKIAEAFVDPDVQLDSTIKKPGKVLTFTTAEALKYNFCDGEVNSIEEVLKKNNLDGLEIVKYEPSTTEKIISFILNPAVSGILILIMIGGIWFELQHPGIGFALVAAIIAALLYFTPYYLNGLAQNWEIMLFVIGVILIGVEIFLIPGFGVTGILGIVLIFASLILSMLNNYWFNFDFVRERDLISSMSIVLFTFVLTIILVVAGASKMLNSKRFKKIALAGQHINPVKNEVQNVSLLHKTGVTHTVLRPSGKVEIEGEIYDAMTNGEYIEPGQTVFVVEEFNSSLKVKRA